MNLCLQRLYARQKIIPNPAAQMNFNHSRSGFRVSWKMVPAVADAW